VEGFETVYSDRNSPVYGETHCVYLYGLNRVVDCRL